MNRKHVLSMALGLAVLSLVVAAAAQEAGSGGKQAGSKPESAGSKPESAAPREAAYDKLAKGVLTRTLYRAVSEDGYSVEVRDLLVASGNRTEGITLPGAAVCEVRSGSGFIEAGSKPADVRTGSTFSVPEGATLTFESKSELPLMIRVHVFAAR